MTQDTQLWSDGFDIGMKAAKMGARIESASDPTLPKARGMVAGWRLHNGLRTAPTHDPFSDDTWGPAPRPTAQALLGCALRRARSIAGLTRKELVSKVSACLRTIDSDERGEGAGVTCQRLDEYARIYGWSVRDMLRLG